MADEVDRAAAVVAVRLLDQLLRSLEEPGHVRRQASVIARDPDVTIARVAGRLERLVHRLVGRCARGLAVVGDLHRDAPLLREAEAHRQVPVRLVAQRQQLVPADLRERRARIEEDEILERPRARARGIDLLVLDDDLEPGEVPRGEQDDRRPTWRVPVVGRRRHRQGRKDDHGRHDTERKGPSPGLGERVHGCLLLLTGVAKTLDRTTTSGQPSTRRKDLDGRSQRRRGTRGRAPRGGGSR